MQRIAEFILISQQRFIEDWKEENADLIYRDIKLPRRATAGSAGYDFYAPCDFTVEPGSSVLIPTGIRARIESGWTLMIFPRSGLGFKYRIQLNNTVGIIDSDYFYSSNEGHIMIKISNDGYEGKVLKLNKGDAFAQGIFVPFGITVDDEASGVRDGGFGSTDKVR